MREIKLNFDSIMAIERLTDALTENATEIRELKEIMKPELSRTETMRRRSDEILNAKAKAELFVRSLDI